MALSHGELVYARVCVCVHVGVCEWRNASVYAKPCTFPDVLNFKPRLSGWKTLQNTWKM